MRSRDELKCARDERRGSRGDVSLSTVMCLREGENVCRGVPGGRLGAIAVTRPKGGKERSLSKVNVRGAALRERREGWEMMFGAGQQLEGRGARISDTDGESIRVAFWSPRTRAGDARAIVHPFKHVGLLSFLHIPLRPFHSSNLRSLTPPHIHAYSTERPSVH